MFGNALFNPSTTPSPRRHSHLDVSIAPKLSQRRSTMPYIDVAGMSPGLGSMMGGYHNAGRPSTPCFVTPTLGGFSGRRFSYDSPLQTLQALSSGGLPTVNRKAAKRAWAKMSTKKWTRSCKIVSILLLASFAVTLFLVRKMKESSVSLQQSSCNDETGTCEAWEAHHHENNPKENFMELVSQNDHYHSLGEEPTNLWVNRWGDVDEEISGTSQSSDTPNESEINIVEEEPLRLEDLPLKMMDYVESVKTFIGDKISGSDSDVESASDQPEESLNHPSESEQELAPVQQTQLMPEMQMRSSSIPSEAPISTSPSHVHVLDGVTSYHGNTHHHAIMGAAPEPKQGLAPMKPAQINAGYQQPLSGAMQQPGLPQPPVGQLPVPRSHVPSQMNGMPAMPSGHLRPQQGYGVPPAPGMPQQYHGQPAPGMPQQYPAPGMPQQYPAPGMPQQYHGHPAPGMPQQYHGHPAPGMPQQYHGQQAPGHRVAPGINPTRYNQQYQQPQYRPTQGGIIGQKPPHYNGYQNNGQKLPPGVNPHRYLEL